MFLAVSRPGLALFLDAATRYALWDGTVQRGVKQTGASQGSRGTRQEDGQTDSGPERTKEGTKESHQNSCMLNTDVDGDKTGPQREAPNPCQDKQTEASTWQSDTHQPSTERSE